MIIVYKRANKEAVIKEIILRLIDSEENKNDNSKKGVAQDKNTSLTAFNRSSSVLVK